MTRGTGNIEGQTDQGNQVTLDTQEPQDNTLQTNFKTNGTLLETSQSVCPVCLKTIDCQIISKDDKVFMRKYCPDHDSFEVIISSDVNDYLNAVKYNKPGKESLHYQGTVANGCPDDCGLCEAHEQHTCVGVIEITDKCNLNCPVCFADAQETYMLPLELVKKMIDLYVKCESEPEALQISGGEPTLHPDIIEILKYAGEKGIKYPMLNTNGIKLADKDFAKELSLIIQDKNSPLKTPIIYLQFDGFNDQIYRTIRGKSLLDLKMKALDNCRNFGLNVVLVPTIIKGINDHELGKIIEFALEDNNIKMVNFQPSTFIGRYELENKQDKILTIPDILSKIESQTSGLLKKSSFIHIPCPYPTCSVCSYIYHNKDKTIVLLDLIDINDYIKFIKDRAVPNERIINEVNEAIDDLLSMSAIMGTEKTNDAICTTCGLSIPNIRNLVDNITLVQIHAFMDENNFDIKRGKKCCITEILPNGQMIPFCVYNIKYRNQLTQTFKDLL